jgi:hypothetical protein
VGRRVSFEFRPAKRERIPLLLGLAGGTGSGKTMTALLLARGLAGGEPFAFVDTENGRALHYADMFPEMRHATIDAPFRPEKYANAIQAGDQQGFPVIVVDSASHEWYGDGGCLDWQEEIMGGQESRRLMSWIEPKKAHKRMVTRLLQVNAHVILCFRAEPKVDMVDDPDKPGKKKFVAKRSLTGLDGWIPIAEKNLPYELTASFLFMADKPGVPKPIKLPEQLKPLVPLDRPVTSETGRALGEWAAGAAAVAHSPSAGLSVEQFNQLVKDSMITAAQGAEVLRRLFPEVARSSDLTDEGRARVWEELTRVAA